MDDGNTSTKFISLPGRMLRFSIDSATLTGILDRLEIKLIIDMQEVISSIAHQKGSDRVIQAT